MENILRLERLFLAVLMLGLMNSTTTIGAIIVDFDDLDYEFHITGSGYAGLTWDTGNQGYQNNTGYWKVPKYGGNSYPHSTPHNAINTWGCTLLGIGFPTEVDVLGAYFAAQGYVTNWTTGVRVHGYRSGVEVATTPWFNDIDAQPDWFAMNLNGVDRIVIESVPVKEGGGWYGMDDLTYIPEPATLLLLGLSGLALLRKSRRVS